MIYSLKPGLLIPPIPADIPVSVTATSSVADAASEGICQVFQVPKTGTITAMGFATGTTTTADDIACSIQTVSLTTGAPTGTMYGGCLAGSKVLVDADDNVMYEVTFATAATAVKGDLVAACALITYVDGNLTLKSYAATKRGFPYMANYVAAAYALTGARMVTWIKYSDGSYENAGGLPGTLDTLTFDSNDAADEYGIRVFLPNKVKVTGYWGILDLDEGATVKITRGDGLVIATSNTLDKDVRAGDGPLLHQGEFTEEVILYPGVEYILSVVPTTTSAVGLNRITCYSAAAMDALTYGREFHQMKRVDAGGWSYDYTIRPYLGLVTAGR